MAAAFVSKKSKIVQQLSISEEDYSDASPIGKVDGNIRNLVDEINTLDSLVTTSSCAGRIAIYLEGKKKGQPQPDITSDEVSSANAGTGGKGGGQWLFVSHDPLDGDFDLLSSSGIAMEGDPSTPGSTQDVRWIRCKFEPMILHILCSSIDSAQRVQSAALQSGFRESGISSISPERADSTAMAAVRTTGLAFDSLIGYEAADGRLLPMVPASYMRVLVKIANERFVVNKERTERFRELLMSQFASGNRVANEDNGAWEPSDVRKARLRAEGLLRQARNREESGKSVQSKDEDDEDSLTGLGATFD
ncbi:hypothetical protein MBLNU459_g2969t1 [Dothideomycetes sp. NU459]